MAPNSAETKAANQKSAKARNNSMAANQKSVKAQNNSMAAKNPSNPQPIPEHETKQNSGVSASMALQATQKAWDLRQAANAAGDPNAREEILAKAVNKEIEAESFGKAAKYTQSGAFQGLAAGAGLGVQPGVTLGKVTGAVVGGTISSVTGLLGAGVGSVYGAMNGPMWDLGQMASQGVRGVVGDFPNWTSTPSQKKALEKMAMQSKETQAPSKEELEKMKSDAPDDMPQSWAQSTGDIASWRPSVPNMPSMPSLSKGGAALGLGGLGASMPSWGGQDKGKAQPQESRQPQQARQSRNQMTSQSHEPRRSGRHSSKQGGQISNQDRKPQQAPMPKEAPKPSNNSKSHTQVSKTPSPQEPHKPAVTTTTERVPKRKAAPPCDDAATKDATKAKTSPPKLASKPQKETKPSATAQPKQNFVAEDRKENKPKPRKLAPRSNNTKPTPGSTVKKTPRKLETRRSVAA
ncbi:hypothetical protein K504DRAFT_463636 [Pleomassaria siparia CBS 279.74]|uniref:Uncharacterized protein n=1 Tax=Pleomassaria siparia CBS 279.74 TaxID=1314801 RepID=A0A6G1JSJ4_9PLEO|nr:hypothetical protein K504DRAFT_463636 [Pleomassaria siparia CBS 279.74]